MIWADGTYWERRERVACTPKNVMDLEGVPEWRKKEGYGPLRRSFYLDPLESEADAHELPDLFYKNDKSTGETQGAFNSAYENFCKKIDEIASLEEILQVQKGPGIKLPQNWMIIMVHRVFLNDPTLETLDFSNMDVPCSRDEKRVVPKLFKALETNTYLENLELQNCHLQPGETQVLANSLRVNKTLKSLNLEGNALDAQSLLHIADAMQENKGLEILKVQHQKGRAPGVQVEERFSDAIRQNDTLIKLGIQISQPNHRDVIDRKLMKNNDTKRRKRLAAAQAVKAET